MPSLALQSPAVQTPSDLRDRCLAHDLKNLMTVVLSATEVLVRAEAGEPERSALARASLEAARRGAAALRELLAEHEPPPRARTPVACADILDATARLAAHVMPANVGVTVEPTARRLRFTTDRDGLEAALLNLCKNAGEASPAGANIVLSADGVSPVDARAIGLETRAYLRFDVRDLGAGLAPDTLPAAGRPGFTTKPDGQGLGLVSVATFARREGGALRLASTLGEGCVASLYLPRAAALVEVA